MAHADIYIDASLAHLAATIRGNPKLLVNALIERDCGVAIADPAGHPRRADRQAPGTSAGRRSGIRGLRLIRHYKDALGRILEITDTTPADRVTVAFQLKRSRAQHQEPAVPYTPMLATPIE